VPDPAQRSEVEETKQVVLIQIEQARKKGLILEAAQYEKKLRQCNAELREMDMMEAARADEAREPEVDFDVEA
jgi:transcription initiation factor IIE alpha subunit